MKKSSDTFYSMFEAYDAAFKRLQYWLNLLKKADELLLAAQEANRKTVEALDAAESNRNILASEYWSEYNSYCITSDNFKAAYKAIKVPKE